MNDCFFIGRLIQIVDTGYVGKAKYIRFMIEITEKVQKLGTNAYSKGDFYTEKERIVIIAYTDLCKKMIQSWKNNLIVMLRCRAKSTTITQRLERGGDITILKCEFVAYDISTLDDITEDNITRRNNRMTPFYKGESIKGDYKEEDDYQNPLLTK